MGEKRPVTRKIMRRDPNNLMPHKTYNEVQIVIHVNNIIYIELKTN